MAPVSLHRLLDSRIVLLGCAEKQVGFRRIFYYDTIWSVVKQVSRARNYVE